MEIKRRILFCLHLPPPTHGASIVGATLVESVRKISHYELKVIKINTTNTLKGGRALVGVFRFALLVARTILIVLRNRPHVIYVTPSSKGIAFVKDYLYVNVLSFFHKGPILAHFHNKGVRENDGRLFEKMYRHFFSMVTPILLSSRLRGDLSKYVTAENILICANGMGSEHPELLLDKKRYDFLFLSNLIEEKGVLIFLEACKRLNKADFSFTAAIVGAEADVETSTLENFLVENCLSDNVHILGPQYGADKQGVLEQSSILVFPSFYHYECMPLVVLEAMSFGLAVVSTREGALEDLVENGVNGLIVKRRNVEDLFEKLAYLLQNEARLLQMKEASLAKYRRDFTEQAFVDRMDLIFQAASDL